MKKDEYLTRVSFIIDFHVKHNPPTVPDGSTVIISRKPKKLHFILMKQEEFCLHKEQKIWGTGFA